MNEGRVIEHPFPITFRAAKEACDLYRGPWAQAEESEILLGTNQVLAGEIAETFNAFSRISPRSTFADSFLLGNLMVYRGLRLTAESLGGVLPKLDNRAINLAALKYLNEPGFIEIAGRLRMLREEFSTSDDALEEFSAILENTPRFAGEMAESEGKLLQIHKEKFGNLEKDFSLLLNRRVLSRLQPSIHNELFRGITYTYFAFRTYSEFLRSIR